MPAGRPLKFQSAEKLQEQIDAYFEETPKDEWTWTGLALWLDTDKKTLVEYREREEFLPSLKTALLRVENGYEIDLKKHGRSGTIFALKNFDWKDKSEVENSGEQSITYKWDDGNNYTLPPANTFSTIASEQQEVEGASGTPEKREDGSDNQSPH